MRTLLRPVTGLVVGLALASLAVPARRALAEPTVIDQATFKVYAGTRALGTETLLLQRDADTLVIASEVYQMRNTADGLDTLRKSTMLVLRAFDNELHFYRSIQTLAGHRLSRSVMPRESTFTVFTEYDGKGEGITFSLPPGHMYVLDGGVFSLFDVMCRELEGKTFTTRPLYMLALGPRDSVIQATVTDRGPDTLRWGARPVQARRLEFSDGETRFLAWMDAQGRMLRLEQPESRVRVEREPPAVKPRKRPAR